MKKLARSILIVDDEKDILSSLSLYLKHHFSLVETSNDPREISSKISNERFDCVILDMNFRKGVNDGKEGLYWLNFIKETRPETSVILLTAYGNIELAVEALKMGASDFMLKPWKNEKLLSTLIRSLELQKSKTEIKRLKNANIQLSKQLHSQEPLFESKSLKMKEVLNLAKKVAPSDVNILILGENGSGKEVLAKAIHQLSLRNSGPFFKVDLGSIASSLLESELFGHRKGSFTDAKMDRIGKFEMAENGSLFLDEIGNLALDGQSKLLSVLQNRKISPLGSNREMDINVRIISATNSNIHQLIIEGKFRQDLYYRLNTVEIQIPPLRERKEDLENLSQQFLNHYIRKYGKEKMTLSSSAHQKIKSHHWPGNIRELMHSIERAVILGKGEISENLFHFNHMSNEHESNENERSLKLLDVEKQCIMQALSKNKGNISHTAKELGINRNTLYRKMEKHGF